MVSFNNSNLSGLMFWINTLLAFKSNKAESNNLPTALFRKAVLTKSIPSKFKIMGSRF